MKPRHKFSFTIAGVAIAVCMATVFLLITPHISSAKKKEEGFFKDIDTRWMLYKGNEGRTSCENASLSVPLELSWKNNIARSIGASPSAGGEYIFVSTRDRRVVILERTGGERIQRRTFKGGFAGSVVIDATKLYFNTRYPEGKVYGTDINTKDNHFERNVGPSMVSPIVHQGRLFTFSQSGEVRSLNTETGKENWKTKLEGTIEYAPLYLDPFIFVPTLQGKIYKIESSSGDVISEFETDALLLGDLSADGYFLFAASSDGRLFCLEPDSLKIQWQTDLGKPLFSGPAYAKGFLYLSSRQGSALKLAALDGSLLWETELDGIVVCPPAVTDKYAFTGTKSGELAALDIESGKKVWTKTIEEGISCSPLAYMDYLYYCTDRGTVYAFHAK